MPIVFVRLERNSDWGCLYYSPVGFGLRNGTASASLGVPLRDGMPLRVRWPDHSITEEVLHGRTHEQLIADMGQEYTARSSVYGFVAQVRGVAVWVPLEEVEIEVDAADVAAAQERSRGNV
jgi:hypothetical protein